MKILVADDSAFMRTMVKNALNYDGYTDIIEAHNGREAVELCKLHDPDLVFMDIVMPDMTGLEALRQLRLEKPEVCVVMCTAMGQESKLVEALSLGAKGWVPKPFSIQQIVDAAKEATRKMRVNL